MVPYCLSSLREKVLMLLGLPGYQGQAGMRFLMAATYLEKAFVRTMFNCRLQSSTKVDICRDGQRVIDCTFNYLEISSGVKRYQFEVNAQLLASSTILA